MKKLILIFFSILLGLTIYNLLVSDDSNSLKNTSKEVYEYHLEHYGQTP